MITAQVSSIEIDGKDIGKLSNVCELARIYISQKKVKNWHGESFPIIEDFLNRIFDCIPDNIKEKNE